MKWLFATLLAFSGCIGPGVGEFTGLFCPALEFLDAGVSDASRGRVLLAPTANARPIVLAGDVLVQAVDGGIIVSGSNDSAFQICLMAPTDGACAKSTCFGGRLVRDPLRVTPGSLSFSPVVPPNEAELPIQLMNRTDDPMTVGLEVQGSTDFELAERVVEIGSQTSRPVAVRFKPRSIGEAFGQLRVSAGDVSIGVPLTAYGGGSIPVVDSAESFDAGIITVVHPRLGEKRFLVVRNEGPLGQDERGVIPAAPSVRVRMAGQRGCVRPGTLEVVGRLSGAAGPLTRIPPGGSGRLAYDVVGDFFGPAICPVELELAGRWLPVQIYLDRVQTEPCVAVVTPNRLSASQQSHRLVVSAFPRCYLSWIRLKELDAGMSLVGPDSAIVEPGRDLELNLRLSNPASSNQLLFDLNGPGGSAAVELIVE